MPAKKAKKPTPIRKAAAKKPAPEPSLEDSVQAAVQKALGNILQQRQAPQPRPEEAAPLNMEFVVKVVNNNLQIPEITKSNKDIAWVTMVEIVEKLANVVRISAYAKAGSFKTDEAEG